MDLSIIIVNWNTRDVTKDCLESICRYTQGLRYEIIVVDNASSDDSVRSIQTAYPEVKLIQNTSNLGFAHANNQGLAIAAGRYLLLLNSDTLLFDNALRKIVATADSHMEAGVIGCRVLNPDKTLQPTCFMYPSAINLAISALHLNNLFPKSKIFGRERMTWWARDDERDVDVVTGCFMLISRKALDAVGYLDASFFMYGEETDWCYRLKKRGYRVMFSPSAEIIHLGGRSSVQNKPKMVLQLRSGILQFIYKHQPRTTYVVCKCLIALWFALRMPAWLLMETSQKKRSYPMTAIYLKGAWRALLGWRKLSVSS
jgi:GT2 family glycosyltransferase